MPILDQIVAKQIELKPAHVQQHWFFLFLYKNVKDNIQLRDNFQ